MAWRIGVDIDGTFTDVAPVGEDRKNPTPAAGRRKLQDRRLT
jgi:N-methylhydantoinase A/oxoprolinase/acetone carboxylase beta subunit